jgi:predicted ester cyclase
MGLERADLVALYERYLACCNERRFEELADLVAEDVGGSGSVDGRAAYIDRVKAVCTGFPDYRWELQSTVVEEATVAARLIGRGTHTGVFEDIAPTGRRISTQELVVYRFVDGTIAQCWGDLFPVVRDALRAPAGITTH